MSHFCEAEIEPLPYSLHIYHIIVIKTHQTYKVRFIPKCGLITNLSSGYNIKSPLGGAHAK